MQIDTNSKDNTMLISVKHHVVRWANNVHASACATLLYLFVLGLLFFFGGKKVGKTIAIFGL